MRTCQTVFLLMVLLVNVKGPLDGNIAHADIDENHKRRPQYKDTRKYNDKFPRIEMIQRIIGGHPSTIDEHPFMISVNHTRTGHWCVGSIIQNYWILTAAHCLAFCEISYSEKCTLEVSSTKDYVISAGVGDTKHIKCEQIRSIKKFVIHPEFTLPQLNNDIALIEVKKPFYYSKCVQPIKIPQPQDLNGADVFKKYSECRALGWGEQDPKIGKNDKDLFTEGLEEEIVLHFVDLPLISLKQCINLLGFKRVTTRHFCSLAPKGGKDTCSGDSGGPFKCGELLHGITSWGERCARPNSPGVYTRVDTYTKWIENIMSGGPNIDHYSHHRSSSSRAVLNSLLFFLILLLHQ